MKKIAAVIICMTYLLSLCGCREIKYLAYYPHPLLGKIETSADWQEFTIPPLTFEKYDLLAVTFIQGDRTVCNTGLSLFHLCSPEATKELGLLGKQYSDELINHPESSDVKLKEIQKEMSRIVAAEPLPDLAFDLVTANGETEIYEPAFAGGRDDHKLRFDFRNCNQSSWNREKLDAGESEESSKYSHAEIDAHHELCDESHAKTFVKLRLRSPSGMKIDSIKIENNNSPFAMR